jgi:hypothetical protein
LVRLGYHLVLAQSAGWSHDDPCRPAIRIIDDRQLEGVPRDVDGDSIPIILLTGHRGPLTGDTRAFGVVRRRARLNDLFALLQKALEACPRAVPRIPASLSARCIRGRHGWAGAIRSISEKGCLLQSTERLEPNRRVDLCFALPREGLLQIPARPSHLDGKVACLVFRGSSDRYRPAIASYVNTQLTES